jgi:fumarate hydratase subunit alpha
MREITTKQITDTVKKLCVEANITLNKDLKQALAHAYESETSILGKEIIKQLIENYHIAENERIPVCQDTGIAVIFIELGQDIHITGCHIYDAVNEGVRRGYTEGLLRKSVVSDPLLRKNTGDNTPAVIHTDIVPGETLKITVLPKGGGSENTSSLKIFPPATDVKTIKEFIVSTVKKAGANPCPPIVVGVGIGGTFESVTELAKKSLLRLLGSHHPDKYYADLEIELLTQINKTGIGPQGLGGKITALAVFIETHPCHITSLPVAVNIQCHACRHATAIL